LESIPGLHKRLKIRALLSSLEELITRDHSRAQALRTLLQEMNSSLTNTVRIMVSEDLRYKSIVIRRGQSCSETSKRTQVWLKENLQEVWDKEAWPPSSPDYSLLDYFVFAFVGYRSRQSLTTKSRT
jgi:hypothetical protein